ncbi:MAG: FliM/FliN family flagellar motor switch protein [Bacillota bacterium]|nr:FliM/FliN family flagellar motor switch protein [Bacillota bacterium]
MMTNDEIQELLKPLHEGSAPTTVQKVRFTEFTPPDDGRRIKTALDYLDDIQVHVTAELGQATLKIREILGLQEGSVIELNRVAGDAIDLLVNEQKFARGEVLVINDRFVIRVNQVHPPHRHRRREP